MSSLTQGPPPRRSNTETEPHPNPQLSDRLLSHGFNPNAVTYYNFDHDSGELLVVFVSNEAIRYVGVRAVELFSRLVYEHWHGDHKSLAALSDLKQVYPIPVVFGKSGRGQS